MSNVSFPAGTVNDLVQALSDASRDADRVITDMLTIAMPGLSRGEGHEPTQGEEKDAEAALCRLCGDVAKGGCEPYTEEHAAKLWGGIHGKMKQAFQRVSVCWRRLAPVAAAYGHSMIPFFTAAELLEQMALGNVRMDDADDSYRAALGLIRMRQPTGNMPLDELMMLSATVVEVVNGGKSPAMAGSTSISLTTPIKPKKGNKEAAALAEKIKNPKLSNREIAEKVGCHVKSLNKMPKFQAACAALKSGRRDMPRGGRYEGEIKDDGDGRTDLNSSDDDR